jgi:hypothetical protein
MAGSCTRKAKRLTSGSEKSLLAFIMTLDGAMKFDLDDVVTLSVH